MLTARTVSGLSDNMKDSRVTYMKGGHRAPYRDVPIWDPCSFGLPELMAVAHVLV